MFIGHAPAGYICTRLLWSRSHRTGLAPLLWRPFLITGLVESILPDIDLVYFYLIDHRQHPHHSYWIHMPCYWIGAGVLGLLFIVVLKRRRLIPYLVVAEANLMLHLFLDTIVGKVYWLYPLSSEDIYLFTIPRVHGWWVWDFVLHWTFLLEIALWIAAMYVFALSGHEERDVTCGPVVTETARIRESSKTTAA